MVPHYYYAQNGVRPGSEMAVRLTSSFRREDGLLNSPEKVGNRKIIVTGFEVVETIGNGLKMGL